MKLRCNRAAVSPVARGLCLCAPVAIALLALASSAQTPQPPDPATAILARLQPREAVQHELTGGQSHSYAIRIEAGQFLHAIVTQSGVDVVVRLFGPDGQKVVETDAASGTQGMEPLFWVAQAQGDYRLEVSSKNLAANPGRYQIKVADRRTAVPEDLKRVEAQQMFREAQNWAAKNDYDRALPAYEQALKLFRDTHDLLGEANSLNNLGIACIDLNQYDRAIGHHEQALAIRREIKDRQGEADSLNNLGRAYNDLNQNEKAIAYHEQALAIRREIKDREGEGTSLNSLGLCYTDLSQYDKAIGYLQESLAIKRELKNRRGEAVALANLATVYQNLSQFERAIDYNGQALTIFRDIKNSRGESNTLANLGNAYLAVNQIDKAIDYIQQSLAMKRELKDRMGEAVSLSSLGHAHLYLGTDLPDKAPSRLTQLEKAISYLEQALAIQREIKDREREAESLQALRGAYHELGQHQKALDLAGQALTIFGEIKERQRVGSVLGDLGTEYRDLNQPDKAITFHVRALAIAREVKDRFYEAYALVMLMVDWQASAQPRLAIFYGKQGLNTLQSIRSDIKGLSPESQQSFLKSCEKGYHTLADLLISQGRIPEAQQVLSLLKDQEYFGFVRGDSNESTGAERRAGYTAEEAGAEKRYRDVGDRLVAIGAEHGALIEKKTLTPAETVRLAQLEKDLEAGNAAFQQVLGDLTTQFSAKPAAAAKLEQIRDTQGLMEDLRELPAGTVAIYTLAGDEKYRVILITPDVQKAFAYSITAADLNRKVLAFREAVQNPKLDPRPLGEELYKILVGPMADDLRQAKAQTLMWSLDGALRYVPLGALFDGKQYLIEQYRMSVFTPASNARLKDRPDQRWTAAGFGVTKAHEGASALPEVAAEMAGIIRQTAGTMVASSKVRPGWTSPSPSSPFARICGSGLQQSTLPAISVSVPAMRRNQRC